MRPSLLGLVGVSARGFRRVFAPSRSGGDVIAASAVLLLTLGREGNSQSAPPVAAPDPAAAAAERRVGGRPAADWLRELKSDVMQSRRRACWALSKFGPAAKEAVAPLTAALEDDDSTVRNAAADALGAMGAAAAPAIPKLVEHLDDLEDCLPFTQPVDEVRKHAASALARIGAPSVPALVEALGSEKKTRRIGAALAFSAMAEERVAARPALEPLRKLFVRNDFEQQFAAALALVALDPPATVAASFLFGVARSGDPYALAFAIASIESLGPPAVARLEPLLDLDGGLFRVRAAESIVHLDPHHAAALALLEEKVGSEAPGEAAAALEGLGRARGAAAVPVFRAALASPDWEARATAAVLVYVHDPTAADRGGPFERILADLDDDDARRFALSLLRERAGAEARPLLERLLPREERAIRVAAASELAEIDPNHPAAIAVLDAAMKRYTDPAHDQEPAKKRTPADEERLRAAVARFAAASARLRTHRVRMMSPPTPGDDLAKLITDDAYPEFERAMMAIYKEGRAATEFLKPLLADADPGVRLEAAEMLLDWIPDDPEPRRVLLEALRDPVDSFDVGERLALKKPPGIADALRAALKDDDALMRLAVARPLLKIEPGDEEALLALLALLPEAANRLGDRAAAQLGDVLVKDPSGLVARRLAELIRDPATKPELRLRCAKLVVNGPIGGDPAALREKQPQLVESATACLLALCKEGDPKLRADAAAALVDAASHDPVALATMIDLLRDPDVETWNRALWCLMEHGEPVLLRLTKLVLDPGADPAVRARAAWSIGGMGGIAISAVRRILKEAPPDCRRTVLESADRWDENESRARDRARRDGSTRLPRSTKGELVVLLRGALKDEDGDVRAVAAEKLFDVDKTQESWTEAYEVALAELDAADGRRCYAVAQRFWTVGHRTRPELMTEMPSAAQELARALLRARMTKELEARITDRERSLATRMASAQALAAIDGGVARLVQLAPSADAATVTSAAWGLGFADGFPDPKPAAVDALKPLLDASQRGADRWVELRAAEALLRLERETDAAKAKLEQLAGLDDGRLAGAARDALERFRREREARGR
jgi:HEAT repeat protein